MGLNFWQVALVAILFLLLFGRGKIPQLMGDLAEGIKSFKKGMGDIHNRDDQLINDSVKETVTASSNDSPEVRN